MDVSYLFNGALFLASFGGLAFLVYRGIRRIWRDGTQGQDVVYVLLGMWFPPIVWARECYLAFFKPQEDAPAIRSFGCLLMIPLLLMGMFFSDLAAVNEGLAVKIIPIVYGWCLPVTLLLTMIGGALLRNRAR